MTFTDAQLAEYDAQGAVTIDPPFTVEQLDRAEQTWDRLKANGGAKPYDDPDFVELIQHPYFEEVAKKLLRADAVHLWWGFEPHERPPTKPPYAESHDLWARGCHVDVQATLEDFEATPRRMRAELWLWLNDVPPQRGAMRILPGSHLPIMEHWSRILQPEHKAMLPRIHGMRPAPAAETSPSFPEYIPDMGPTPWVDRKPIASVARRGQMLLLCSAGLHSAWQNQDTVPRKAMGASWVAKGVSCGMPKIQRDAMMACVGQLRSKLRPDRAHIVPDHFEWVLESDYEPKWPEACLPSHNG
jgi:ectoine hydroxylase-related dioxygenase (phytanoyl-CoA dioxygenase family)